MGASAAVGLLSTAAVVAVVAGVAVGGWVKLGIPVFAWRGVRLAKARHLDLAQRHKCESLYSARGERIEGNACGYCGGVYGRRKSDIDSYSSLTGESDRASALARRLRSQS